MARDFTLRFVAVAVLMGSLLNSAHAQAGPCKDPWITQAYRELYNRMPVGTATTGDCDITHYGNGHWSTYQDLKSKVAAHNATYSRPVPPSSAAQYAPLVRPNSTARPVAAVAPSSAVVNRNGSRIISQDGGSLISDAGGNAKPTSSLISQDGGGFSTNSSSGIRSLQSVDKPQAPAGKYLVIPGGNLVDAYGNTVRWAGAYSIVVKNGVNVIGTNGRTPVPGTVVTP